MARDVGVPRPSILDIASRRVVIYDGASGTSLHAAEPTVDDFGGPALEGWVDGLTLHAPHIVEGIHRSFLDAGADVIETHTFQSTRPRFAEWGQADRVVEVNRSAAQLARRLADEYSTAEQPRFVAGSMGPTGYLPSSSDITLSAITFRELVDAFA